MNIDKINIYRAGYGVERLHTIAHIRPYNNGFHSANAALIGMELAKLNSLKTSDIVLWLLLHDIHEGYIGDIPANVKVDNPSLRDIVSDIETKWEKQNIDLPTLCIESKRLCKAADLIELGMYCLEEFGLGNRNMIPVIKNVVEYLRGYRDIEGVNEFCFHFVHNTAMRMEVAIQ